MTSESEREQQLRRLLSEAVDPVQPAPGAQTRLLAKARAQAQRKSRGPLILRWGVPVALASLVIAAVVTLAFAVHGDRSNSSASTSAGGATVNAPAKGSADAAQASAGPSTAAGARGSATNAQPASPQLESGKNTTTYSGGAPNAATTDGGQLSLRALSADVDGDGTQDPIAVQAGSLVTTLSRYGVQRVTLPPPVARAAGVLGVTTLSDPNGNAVRVVFVRLTQAGTASTDTIVAVVKGRLTVLRQGRDPVLLTIDPTHGYGCNQRSLAISGNTTPFVVDGSALVASPQLRAVVTPPAKAAGCF
jgi:hypothetical protein